MGCFGLICEMYAVSFVPYHKTYLSNKVPDERIIRVLLFQTAVNITDDSNHITSTQQMYHSIQNCFLELELKMKKADTDLETSWNTSGTRSSRTAYPVISGRKKII